MCRKNKDNSHIKMVAQNYNVDDLARFMNFIKKYLVCKNVRNI